MKSLLINLRKIFQNDFLSLVEIKNIIFYLIKLIDFYIIKIHKNIFMNRNHILIYK